MPVFLRLFLVSVLSVMAVAVFSAGSVSDTAKEQRWAEQITDQLIVGEPLYLEADGHRFFAIYTPAETSTTRGTVLLVHGIGAHPDWPQVIQPLRSGLSERGWQSLSIQMPLPPEGIDAGGRAALLHEGGDRLQAALAWLQARNMTPVTLIAHSRGGVDVLHFAATHPDAPIVSVVVISTSGVYQDVPVDVGPLQSLRRIKQPVLDTYGENDHENVVNTAAERRKAAAGNTAYRQLQVPGADHFYDGQEAQLLKAVTGWLQDHP
jgi:pimeloyl-ACP methyl ester carboxylesterase